MCQRVAWSQFLIHARCVSVLPHEVLIMVDQSKVLLIRHEFIVAKSRLEASVDPRDVALVAFALVRVFGGIAHTPALQLDSNCQAADGNVTLKACFRIVFMIKFDARRPSDSCIDLMLDKTRIPGRNEH